MAGVALKQAKVYVVQDDGLKNLMPALKFGSLEILISGRDNQLYNTAPLVADLQKKLLLFDPEIDYLLLVGDPAAIAVCAMICGKATNSPINLLKWDRQERAYYPLKVDINQYNRS